VPLYDHETVAIDNHRSPRTRIDTYIDRSHTPPASIAIDRPPRGAARDSRHPSIDMTVESARASIERANPSMARDASPRLTRTRRRAIVRSRASRRRDAAGERATTRGIERTRGRRTVTAPRGRGRRGNSRGASEGGSVQRETRARERSRA